MIFTLCDKIGPTKIKKKNQKQQQQHLHMYVFVCMCAPTQIVGMKLKIEIM